LLRKEALYFITKKTEKSSFPLGGSLQAEGNQGNLRLGVLSPAGISAGGGQKEVLEAG